MKRMIFISLMAGTLMAGGMFPKLNVKNGMGTLTQDMFCVEQKQVVLKKSGSEISFEKFSKCFDTKTEAEKNLK